VPSLVASRTVPVLSFYKWHRSGEEITFTGV